MTEADANAILAAWPGDAGSKPAGLREALLALPPVDEWIVGTRVSAPCLLAVSGWHLLMVGWWVSSLKTDYETTNILSAEVSDSAHARHWIFNVSGVHMVKITTNRSGGCWEENEHRCRRLALAARPNWPPTPSVPEDDVYRDA